MAERIGTSPPPGQRRVRDEARGSDGGLLASGPDRRRGSRVAVERGELKCPALGPPSPQRATGAISATGPTRMLNQVRRALESDAAACLLLYCFFFSIYIQSLDIYSANFVRFNFLFDADIARVARVYNGIGSEGSMHHPLYVLFLGSIGSWLYTLVGDRILTATLVSVSIASLAAPAGYLVLVRILGDRISALFFSTAVGLSSSVWLLSSIPETWAINHLFIVLCFLLQDGRYASPLQSVGRFAVFLLVSVAAVGVTLPNLAYVGLAYLNNLRHSALSNRHRALSLLAYGSCLALLLAGLSEFQQARHPRAYDHLRSSPIELSRQDRDYLRLDRELAAAELSALARTFLVDSVLAREAGVVDLQTGRGPQQFVQFLPGATPLYWLTVALALLLGTLVVAANDSRRETLAHAVVQLAFAYVGFNFALHLFFRGHGQPFLFSIHLVFSLIVLLASFFAGCRSRLKLPLLVLVVGLLVLNNFRFIDGTNDLLNRRCLERAESKLPICLEWETQPQPAQEHRPS